MTADGLRPEPVKIKSDTGGLLPDDHIDSVSRAQTGPGRVPLNNLKSSRLSVHCDPKPSDLVLSVFFALTRRRLDHAETSGGTEACPVGRRKKCIDSFNGCSERSLQFLQSPRKGEQHNWCSPVDDIIATIILNERWLAVDITLNSRELCPCVTHDVTGQQ